jgi:outer membrane protein assembly factor BamE (lipoprotein component of BamABCDE complex)
MSQLLKYVLGGVASCLILSAFAMPNQAVVEQTTTEEFPAFEKSYLKQVKRYEAGDVARLQANLNKDQVRHLLGNPHFDEGVFGPKVWNYVLDVRLPKSAQYQRCELHLEFDKHGFVRNVHWKDSVCAQLQKEWMTGAAL